MADNFTTKDASDATITGAADEIAGVKIPRVKLIHGADGTSDGDVSTANGLPVQGTVTAELSATDNAVLDTIAGDTTSLDGKVTACNTGAVVLAAGTAEVGKLAAGTALIGKVGIDQSTANANEVVVKSGSCTVDLGANNDVTVTNATAANCKVEATIAAAQTIAVTNAGTFAVQAAPTVPAGATAGQGKLDHADVTTAQAITTAVADKYFYITSLTISSSVAGNFWVEDDDATQITCKFYFAPNGGSTQTFTPQTPWKSTTVNKGLKIKGSVAGSIGAMITYYTAT